MRKRYLRKKGGFTVVGVPVDSHSRWSGNDDDILSLLKQDYIIPKERRETPARLVSKNAL